MQEKYPKQYQNRWLLSTLDSTIIILSLKKYLTVLYLQDSDLG